MQIELFKCLTAVGEVRATLYSGTAVELNRLKDSTSRCVLTQLQSVWVILIRKRY